MMRNIQIIFKLKKCSENIAEVPISFKRHDWLIDEGFRQVIVGAENIPVGVDDLPDRGVSFVVRCRKRGAVAACFHLVDQQVGSRDPFGFFLLLFGGGLREAAFVEFPL